MELLGEGAAATEGFWIILRHILTLITLTLTLNLTELTTQSDPDLDHLI